MIPVFARGYSVPRRRHPRRLWRELLGLRRFLLAVVLSVLLWLAIVASGIALFGGTPAMSDRQYDGLEVHVRGRIERNSKSFNREHTVSVDGRMKVAITAGGKPQFFIETDRGAIGLGNLLDALHQEAAAANNREINRQQREQVAAIQAGA